MHLHWYGAPTNTRLQIARDAEFASVVVDSSRAASPVRVTLPNSGQYFWRVVSYWDEDVSGGSASETGVFTVANGGSTAVEAGETPQTPTLAGVFPNPASSQVTVRLGMPGPGSAEVALYDVIGRRILSSTHRLSTGANDLHLPVRRLASGVYLIRVQLERETLMATVIVR